MRKQEFLSALKSRLAGMPRGEVAERLNFYSEMIDDRIEEGSAEEDAVLDIGSVEEVAAQIIADIPLVKIAKEKVKPKRRFELWEIVLLVLGSPVWASLLIAFFAIILSFYVVLWSLVVSLWSLVASLAACAFGGIIAGAFFAAYSNTITGVAVIGAGIACAGLAIFLYFGSRVATKSIISLPPKIALKMKKSFVEKENESCVGQ